MSITETRPGPDPLGAPADNNDIRLAIHAMTTSMNDLHRRFDELVEGITQSSTAGLTFFDELADKFGKVLDNVPTFLRQIAEHPFIASLGISSYLLELADKIERDQAEAVNELERGAPV